MRRLQPGKATRPVPQLVAASLVYLPTLTGRQHRFTHHAMRLQPCQQLGFCQDSHENLYRDSGKRSMATVIRHIAQDWECEGDV